jgi:hypothetical protein
MKTLQLYITFNLYTHAKKSISEDSTIEINLNPLSVITDEASRWIDGNGQGRHNINSPDVSLMYDEAFLHFTNKLIYFKMPSINNLRQATRKHKRYVEETRHAF